MSAVAKEALRREYIRRIDNGSILLPNGGFDPRLYSGEVIFSVLALGIELDDQKLKTWSYGQIDAITQRLANNNGFWIWPDPGEPTFGQLSQARLLLSLTFIYARTGYPPARTGALLAYGGLQRMPRSLVTSRLTGRQYSLTNYGYQNINAPVILTTRELSPNHDAVIAAAYLAASVHILESPQDVSEALNQYNIFKSAAIDLATSDKCLPLDGLPEYSDLCDTRYNGYWASSLALILSIRFDDSVRQALLSQTAYFRSNLLNFQTRRYYPDLYQGNYPDPVEPVLFWPNLPLYLNAEEVNLYIGRTNSFIETENPALWPSGNLYPAYYF